MSNSVKEYLRLPYTRRAEKIENEGVTEFVAYVEEIPWVRVHADEREEAYFLLGESLEDALQAMIDAGDEIPIPAGTFERYGEPHSTESAPDKPRWSTSMQPDAINFEPDYETESWASGNVDPERALTSEIA
ncbi:MAG: hypothetical protein U5R14_14510 [Gemmatimonadota bacterium]|nr:hypothetical protein [Gemmatimonadota bacterium]